MLSVLNRATHFIGVVEKHLPTRTTPDGMIHWPYPKIAKRQAAGFLEIGDHFFGEMLVFADEKVNMVRHDGTGIARIFLLCDDVDDDRLGHAAAWIVG